MSESVRPGTPRSLTESSPLAPVTVVLMWTALPTNSAAADGIARADQKTKRDDCRSIRSKHIPLPI